MCATRFLVSLLLVHLAEVRILDATKEAGCPSIAQRSRHFAKAHNGTCYLFMDDERYWSEARKSCWTMGGEMLSVENYNTMVFIRSVLNSRQLGWNKKGVWLGARYRGGVWQWTTGKGVGYANWASGEPSKILGVLSVEDCALMRRVDNWRWHDYICGSMKYHYNYICQFPYTNRGYNEVHSTSQLPNNGNVTILTIILAIGGIVLLALLLVYFIVRKKYNYKKAMAQPAVLFENRNYNHTHHQPQPPPPAPHSFHAAAPPPVPPRPSETCMPFYSSANRSPHVPLFPHLGHSCPTDLYLTPLDTGDLYEEVRAPGDVGFHHVATASSQPSAPALNEGVLGACGGASQEDLDNISTAPLIPASEGAALWGQSQESLHSMSGSLTMKTSSIHNDYVDMNGSPVVPARCRNQEESAAKSTGQDEQWKPGASLSGGDGSDEHPGQEAGKQAFGPNYSNLMTTSQERCENLYAQLH